MLILRKPFTLPRQRWTSERTEIACFESLQLTASIPSRRDLYRSMLPNSSPSYATVCAKLVFQCIASEHDTALFPKERAVLSSTFKRTLRRRITLAPCSDCFGYPKISRRRKKNKRASCEI